MTREIKFRAWDNNTMYYNVNVGFSNPSVFNGAWSECTEQAIIMQYTGFQDKNGKEIYEGDIITYPVLGYDKPQKKAVKFCNGCFGVFTGNGAVFPMGGALTEFGILGNGLVHEVIGNIYENPELLEGGTE